MHEDGPRHYSSCNGQLGRSFSVSKPIREPLLAERRLNVRLCAPLDRTDAQADCVNRRLTPFQTWACNVNGLPDRFSLPQVTIWPIRDLATQETEKRRNEQAIAYGRQASVFLSRIDPGSRVISGSTGRIASRPDLWPPLTTSLFRFIPNERPLPTRLSESSTKPRPRRIGHCP